MRKSGAIGILLGVRQTSPVNDFNCFFVWKMRESGAVEILLRCGAHLNSRICFPVFLRLEFLHPQPPGVDSCSGLQLNPRGRGMASNILRFTWRKIENNLNVLQSWSSLIIYSTWIECVLSNESEIYKDILAAWKVIIVWAKGGKQNIKYSV